MTKPDPATPRFYAGHMLLAMPGIGDPRFEHTAIALCSHSEHGALGIDVGHVIEGLSLRDLLANFELESHGLEQVPVLRGGPVDPQRGFVLHSLDWSGQDLLEVNGEWGLSGSLDILKAISEGRGPERYLVALGYAGWSAGQLEHEIPPWLVPRCGDTGRTCRHCPGTALGTGFRCLRRGCTAAGRQQRFGLTQRRLSRFVAFPAN